MVSSSYLSPPVKIRFNLSPDAITVVCLYMPIVTPVPITFVIAAVCSMVTAVCYVVLLTARDAKKSVPLGADPANNDDTCSKSQGHGQHPTFPVCIFSINTMLIQDILAHIRADAHQDLIHSLSLSIATLYNAQTVLTTIATDSILYPRQGCKPTKPGPRRFMDTAP